MRIVFVIAGISMVWSNLTLVKSNDQIDKLIATVAHMSEKVNVLAKDVAHIKKDEEKMENVVIHAKESVKALVMKEEGMENQFAEIKAQATGIKTQISEIKSDMKTQIDSIKSKVKTQIDEIRKDLKNTGAAATGRYPFAWKYMGRGWGSYSSRIHTRTTFQHCMDFCESKRSTDGSEWNGMWWKTDSGYCGCTLRDRGHNPDPLYMHFKIE